MHVARGSLFVDGTDGLRQLAWKCGRLEEVARATLGGSLLSISPDGDFVSLSTGVHRWPSLEPIFRPARYPQSELVADWQRRELIHVHWQRPNVTVEVRSLDGTLRDSIRTESEWPWSGWTPLGGGAVLDPRDGLVIYAHGGGLHRLLETRAPVAPSLAADGRSLRTLIAGIPRRWTLERETRAVLSAPDAPSFQPAHRHARAALWHPHADVAFIRRARRFELVAPERDEPLLELEEGVIPHGWTEAGRALVVLRDARRPGPEVRIEIWR
jgi:hypothetical protein